MPITTHKSKKSSCANWLKPGKHFKPFVILNDTQWSSVFTSLIASDTQFVSMPGVTSQQSTAELQQPGGFSSSLLHVLCSLYTVWSSHRCYRNKGGCWYRRMLDNARACGLIFHSLSPEGGSQRLPQRIQGLCATQGNSREKSENKNVSGKPNLDQHGNFLGKKGKK